MVVKRPPPLNTVAAKGATKVVRRKLSYRDGVVVAIVVVVVVGVGVERGRGLRIGT